MLTTKGYAAASATSPLQPFSFERRDLQKEDVLIDILYCGICHSDLHLVRNEWNSSTYPMVPGHEIIGRVKEVGPSVTQVKKGDIVGVGCIIGSCLSCPSCRSHLEQYCDSGYTFVFNTIDPTTKMQNQGGFSKHIVVNENYVLRIPKALQGNNLAATAPLLCAGITTYSPLKHWNVGKGSHVGIIGLGGLGHMAVKIAHAMGAHITVFTTSSQKIVDAKKLGADDVVLSKDTQAMAKVANTFDFLLNTVSSVHDLNTLIPLLKQDATMCLVGLPSEPYQIIKADPFIRKRRNLAGSLIGSIKETQEMLDFCASHHVLADIELISIAQVNEAFERMIKSDVKYRFVIDMATL